MATVTFSESVPGCQGLPQESSSFPSSWHTSCLRNAFTALPEPEEIAYQFILWNRSKQGNSSHLRGDWQMLLCFPGNLKYPLVPLCVHHGILENLRAQSRNHRPNHFCSMRGSPSLQPVLWSSLAGWQRWSDLCGPHWLPPFSFHRCHCPTPPLHS